MHQDQLPAKDALDELTLGDFLEEWLAAVEFSVRPRTLQRYREYVRLHTRPMLGDRQLVAIVPRDLRQLYADRISSGQSHTSVLHLHRMLHRAFSLAIKWGYVERNPTEAVEGPRSIRRNMRTLTPDEARRFLESAKQDRLNALYVLAITTGMRQGELLALRWRDVDIIGRTLQVTASLQYLPGRGLELAEPKTSRSRRRIVLGDLAITALLTHRSAQSQLKVNAGERWLERDLVFTNRRGGPLYATNLIKRSFPQLLARADLPRIRFHDLRHTTATLLLGEGIHPKLVSEMLGHSTITMTLDLYSHATPTMHSAATAALDGLLNDNIGSIVERP